MELKANSFECAVCLDLLYKPTTLPCGHNFCYSCIAGLHAHCFYLRCPVCRSPFPMIQYKANLLLEQVIAKGHSDRYLERALQSTHSNQIFPSRPLRVLQTLKPLLLAGAISVFALWLVRRYPNKFLKCLYLAVRFPSFVSGSFLWHSVWTLLHIFVRYIEATTALSGLSH